MAKEELAAVSHVAWWRSKVAVGGMEMAASTCWIRQCAPERCHHNFLHFRAFPMRGERACRIC